MSYRDDLAAAHARIAVLEAELARAREECARLVEELEGRQRHALSRDAAEREHELARERERRLEEKMRREDAEVRAKVRQQIEEAEREAAARRPRFDDE